jgi:hypothetical protein
MTSSMTEWRPCAAAMVRSLLCLPSSLAISRRSRRKPTG